jgi:hypothetical protein
VTIGFLHVETSENPTGRICARGMVASCKRVMPTVRVIQFADMDTPAVDGADEVKRLPLESLALLRFRHQAAVKGDWLFLDTDVIVQKDVRKVFHNTFHVAMTTRNWKHLRPAEGFAERMPFNAGVIFSRSPSFWRECTERLEQSDIHDQEFMGHQQIICDVVMSQRYQIAYVKGSAYNCPPYVDDGREGGDEALGKLLVSQAHIVHYKGALRKPMLLSRLRKEFGCA